MSGAPRGPALSPPATGAAGPICVLGASGYLGSALVDVLAGRPGRVRAVARHPSVAVTSGPARVETVAVDVTDRAALAAAVDGAGAVAHLVGDTGGPTGWRRLNDDTLADRLTTGVVGDVIAVLGRRPPGGEPPVLLLASTIGPDEPQDPYERRKRGAEALVRTATAAGLVRGISIRLPTVCGPPVGTGAVGQGLVSAMIDRALAGESLTMWGDGTVRRDLIDVRDVARAFVAALDHAPALAGRAWEVGSGRGVTVRIVLETIAGAVAAHTDRSPVPVVAVPPPSWASSADAEDRVADPSPFRSVTGWSPTYPLGRTIAGAVAALAAAIPAGGQPMTIRTTRGDPAP